jgi:hypothetical protein
MRPKPTSRVIGVVAILLSALWLLGLPIFAQAQSLLVIHPGETVAGDVTSRAGQTWQLHGCTGDVISLTVSSERFVPFLALSDSTSSDSLIEAEGDEETSSAAISEFTLPRNDTYTVLVAGSTVRDRGDYQLTLDSSAATGADETGTLEIFPGESITGEVTNRFGSEILFAGCAGDVVSFTLESAAFAPRLELFGPSGRDPLISDRATAGGAAAQISGFVLPERGLYTLVASGASIRDRGAFTLAMNNVGDQPATATPTFTPSPTLTPSPTPLPTPTQTPTPAAQASALLPQGVVVQVNGGDGDLMGEILMNPSYMISAMEDDDTIVVRDNFYLELFVLDLNSGFFDGAGIDHVEFVFDCPNGEQFVHVERQPRFCSFGDDGGSCNVLRLRSGEMFPGSSCEIVNDFYSVNITAYPTNPDLTPGNWNFNIRPEIP